MQNNNIDKIKKELGICGISNIPNQIHHITSYQRINFNILLMGSLSCGKTLFVNKVLGKQVFTHELGKILSSADRESGITIRVREQNLMEDDVCARMQLIDAPLIGYSIPKQEGYSALINYCREQLVKHYEHEIDVNRAKSDYKDNRVHVCLYFISPHQKKLSKEDIKQLKDICQYTNIIIVTGKADLLTNDELYYQCESLHEQCATENIQIFSFENQSPFPFPFSCRRELKCKNLESLLVKKYLPILSENIESIYYETFVTQNMQISEKKTKATEQTIFVQY